ncbi:MAG: tetratricopeptide repeat protein [Planctomycetota bacterium]
MSLWVGGVLTLGLTLATGRAAAQTGEELLSDMLQRVVFQTLADTRGDGELRLDQLERARVLLESALELTPNDGQAWGNLYNVLERSGDRAAAMKALRKTVELRPQDDALRLQLVLWELAEVATLDGRLAVLEERLAGQSGGAMSDALRSRLASAAAAAAQEIGDNKRYFKHLKTAVRADPANGEAAILTYRLAVEKDASPVKLAAAAINLVRARPTDSEARLVLGDALASLGVYDRAAQQFEVASRLPRSEPISPSFWSTWTRSLIASGQTRRAAELLDQIEAGLATPDEADEAQMGLRVEVDLHRRVLHGDNEEGRAAYDRVVTELQNKVDGGDRDAGLELAWVKAVFGPDTDEVGPLLESQERSDPRYLRATGFMFMREGTEQWARQAFTQAAETDALSAYGLALLQGRDDAGRARFVRKVVHDWPGTFGGVLAARKLQEMGRDVLPSAQGQAIIDAMNRLPVSLWRFDTERNPWVSVRARFDTSRTEFLEPIRVELVLQNNLDMPLPLDPAVGLGTTGLVTVSAFSRGENFGQLPPIVLDLGRRLTLGPKERWATEVRLDRSVFGLLLTTGTPRTVSYNSTFISSPAFLPNGAVVAGTLGAIDTVRSVQAFVPSLSNETLQSWTRDLALAQGRERFVALARVAQVSNRLNAEGIDSAAARSAVAALVEAFEKGSAVEQAWVLLTLVSPESSRSAYQPILELGRRSDNALVQTAYLIGQVSDPDDNALVVAIRDGSPAVKRFAQALQTALRLPPPEPAAAPTP